MPHDYLLRDAEAGMVLYCITFFSKKNLLTFFEQRLKQKSIFPEKIFVVFLSDYASTSARHWNEQRKLVLHTALTERLVSRCRNHYFHPVRYMIICFVSLCAVLAIGQRIARTAHARRHTHRSSASQKSTSYAYELIFLIFTFFLKKQDQVRASIRRQLSVGPPVRRMKERFFFLKVFDERHL